MILDSNVVIYSIQPAHAYLSEYLAERLDQLYASAITKIEVVGFHRLDQNEIVTFNNFFDVITTLPITPKIITEAIRLRQQRKRSLGDSIIAATALIYKLPVLTNNTADFLNVAGIEVIALDSVPRS